CNDLGVVRSLLGRVTLGEDGKRSAIPVTNEISAPAIRGPYHARDAPDASIAARPLERIVVAAEIVDIEQSKPDLVRIALCQQPPTFQQLFEVSPRMQARQAILTQPRRQARAGALGIAQAITGITVITDVMGHLAGGITYRLNHCFIPEQRTVGA